MATVTLRCHAELNAFLPPEQRQRDIALTFEPPTPVKHLAETLGIPHTEIALVLRNATPLPLDYRVRGGELIELHPWLDASGRRIATALDALPRFVADAHLGKLAAYLRLLGFDTCYHNDLGDTALAALAESEQRILLSRDRKLLMRRNVQRGCYIRQQRPREQLHYVLKRLPLCELRHPFTRCLACNGQLERVQKDAVLEHLPPAVARLHDDFWRCDGCARVYWQGSHWRALAALVAEVCGDGDP
jgi:uncharacterized protein with PIN domain